MSRSISPPWIANYVLGLVQDRTSLDNNLSLTVTSSCPIVTGTKRSEPKVVQVLHVLPEYDTIIISDTVNSIAVFITPEGVRELLADSDSSGNCLDRELRYCQIKIDNYHLSTMVQCASKYDIENIRSSNKIACPLAIHCSRVVYLGAHDCEIMGNPSDINADFRLRRALTGISYSALMNSLIRQFPLQMQLPDLDNQFNYPLAKSDECQLDAGEFIFPQSTAETALMELKSFEHSAMIKFHESLQLPQPHHQQNIPIMTPAVTASNAHRSIEALAQSHDWMETWTETQLEETMADGSSINASDQARCPETLLDIESIQGLHSTQTSDSTLPASSQQSTAAQPLTTIPQSPTPLQQTSSQQPTPSTQQQQTVISSQNSQIRDFPPASAQHYEKQARLRRRKIVQSPQLSLATGPPPCIESDQTMTLQDSFNLVNHSKASDSQPLQLAENNSQMLSQDSSEATSRKRKTSPKELIGKRVRKEFDEGFFEGVIVSCRSGPGRRPLWMVHFDDGDKEELNQQSVKRYLIPTPSQASSTTEGVKESQPLAMDEANLAIPHTSLSTRDSSVVDSHVPTAAKPVVGETETSNPIAPTSTASISPTSTGEQAVAVIHPTAPSELLHRPLFSSFPSRHPTQSRYIQQQQQIQQFSPPFRKVHESAVSDSSSSSTSLPSSSSFLILHRFPLSQRAESTSTTQKISKHNQIKEMISKYRNKPDISSYYDRPFQL